MKKVILSLVVLLGLLVAPKAQELYNTNVADTVFGIGSYSNLTLAVYPSYAPDLINGDGRKDQWGAGAALVYSFEGTVGEHLFAGVRVDYLGHEFWAPSINGGLKADLHFGSITLTPFMYTGVIWATSGAGDQNGDGGVLFGAGAKVTVWRGQLLGANAEVGVGAAVEKWSNFAGQVYHIAPVLKLSF